MKSTEPISVRVRTLRGFLATHNIKLKELCEVADLNYHSVKNNMGVCISKERMNLLEQTALDLSTKLDSRKGNSLQKS